MVNCLGFLLGSAIKKSKSGRLFNYMGMARDLAQLLCRRVFHSYKEYKPSQGHQGAPF